MPDGWEVLEVVPGWRRYAKDGFAIEIRPTKGPQFRVWQGYSLEIETPERETAFDLADHYAAERGGWAE